MTRLDVANLGVDLEGAAVLRAIGCSFQSGELIGVIGPNGAGKSSLLRAIAGLLPYRGSLALNGREVRAVKPAELSKLRAYLPQGGEVYWPLTANAVVSLGRFPFGDAETETGRAAIGRAMLAADVAQFADRPYPSLSGGERARVLLARALAAETKILIADEPAAQLDPKHAWEALGVLRQAAQNGALAIVALHDLTAASRMCDKVLALAGGEVQAFGTPAAILTPDLLQRVFGVDAHIGQKDGAPYVVPLRASA
jgi:iron complex transport system ATP-binding protein